MDTKAKRAHRDLLATELKQLQEELNREEAQCQHQWGEEVYDPESFREPYGHKLIKQGSDCWAEPEGYRDASRARWSRTCVHCGKTEYTYAQKPAAFVPDFNNHSLPQTNW